MIVCALAVLVAVHGLVTPSPTVFCDACTDTEECPNPEDDGIYCEVRDCWDGCCMNVTATDCDDGDYCTVDSCIEPWEWGAVNEDTFTCISAELENCCRNVHEDCDAPTEACVDVTCEIEQGEHTGLCTYTHLDHCCTCDHDCEDPDNLCLISFCEDIIEGEHGFQEGVCTLAEEIPCAHPNPQDLCLVVECNATSGQCDQYVLPEDECPGACCLPEGCEMSMDEEWCEEDGGIFVGPNTTCDPEICDFSPEYPTCECDDDCEEQLEPRNKCETVACNVTAEVCMYVPVECESDDPCVLSECDVMNGLCREEVLWGCCTPENDDLCINSGEPCHEIQCVNVTDGVGECAEVRLEEAPDCCTSSDECTGDDLCSAAYCRHHDHVCVGIGEQIICPPELDGDQCTEPVCDPLTGFCIEALLPDAFKCPGACCFINYSTPECEQQCEYVDYFTCNDLEGEWHGSNTTCEDEDVCVDQTPAPTESPVPQPTPQPTASCIDKTCPTNGGSVYIDCDVIEDGMCSEGQCQVGVIPCASELCTMEDDVACTCDECTCIVDKIIDEHQVYYREECIGAEPTPSTFAPTPSTSAPTQEPPTPKPTAPPTPFPTTSCLDKACPSGGDEIYMDCSNVFGICGVEVGSCQTGSVPCESVQCTGSPGGSCTCNECTCVVQGLVEEQPVLRREVCVPVTAAPTEQPTPTAQPTAQPTPVQTIRPTRGPPTTQPTVRPTPKPTPQPTISCVEMICPLNEGDELQIPCRIFDNECQCDVLVEGSILIRKNCTQPIIQETHPTEITPTYMDYAHTLCNVLHNCGFATQSVCTDNPPTYCTDLNCCAVYPPPTINTV